jgi:hypothetical protein
MRRAVLVLIPFLPLLGLSCSTCQPPPDPDGVPTGSQPLEVGSWHRDALDCGEGDCADWFWFETKSAGALRIDVAKLDDEEDEDEVPEFSLALAGADGKALADAMNGGKSRVEIAHPKKKGRYVDAQRFAVAVSTPAEREGALAYELRVTFTPKPRPPAPPPAAPRFRTVKAALLEVESQPGGGDAVLIDQGSRSGIERGQRGRLLVGGKKIADIEILDVYPDGSRAAVRGSLGAALAPDTVAEVDVPL